MTPSRSRFWAPSGDGHIYESEHGLNARVRLDDKSRWTWQLRTDDEVLARDTAASQDIAMKRAENALYRELGRGYEVYAARSRRITYTVTVDSGPDVYPNEVREHIGGLLGELAARLDAGVTVDFLSDTGDPDTADRCHWCGQPGDDYTLEPFNPAGNLACRDVKACQRRHALGELPRHLAVLRRHLADDQDVTDTPDPLSAAFINVDHILWLLGVPGASPDPDLECR